MYLLRPAVEGACHLRQSLLDLLQQVFHFTRGPGECLGALWFSYNTIIINKLQKVTAQQLATDSHSTPHWASASIEFMRPSLSPSPNESSAPNLAFYESGFCRQSSKGSWPARDGERGAGRLKPILWTLVLASFVYVAVKVVPALINEFEFQDGIQTIARYASATRQTQEQIRAAVLKEAQKDDVPAAAEDIKVEAVSGNVRIHVEYSVIVDLTVYQWTLNFHPAVSNDSLT